MSTNRRIDGSKIRVVPVPLLPPLEHTCRVVIDKAQPFVRCRVGFGCGKAEKCMLKSDVCGGVVTDDDGCISGRK